MSTQLAPSAKRWTIRQTWPASSGRHQRAMALFARHRFDKDACCKRFWLNHKSRWQLWVNLRRAATTTALPSAFNSGKCLQMASTAGQCHNRKITVGPGENRRTPATDANLIARAEPIGGAASTLIIIALQPLGSSLAALYVSGYRGGANILRTVCPGQDY
jgi:hypothetical protein